jgi:hypothetical protein
VAGDRLDQVKRRNEPRNTTHHSIDLGIEVNSNCRNCFGRFSFN